MKSKRLMMEEKSPGLSESQEKEKLAVPLSRRKNILYAGADDLDKSREIKLEEIDPKKLLEKAQLVRLSDSNKKNYVVIKFSYVLYDVAAGKVGLFSREDVNHHFEKAKHSLLLSSGLEQFYGAIYSGKKIVLNAYHPFTQKIGAYVNCFWLPFVSYREFPFPVRFNALAFRKKEGRHYAFYIHYAVLKPNSLFPRRPFELHYPGFRPVHDYIPGREKHPHLPHLRPRGQQGAAHPLPSARKIPRKNPAIPLRHHGLLHPEHLPGLHDSGHLCRPQQRHHGPRPARKRIQKTALLRDSDELKHREG